jgi:hypothetical protein
MRIVARLSPGHILTLWFASIIIWLATIWYSIDSRGADASEAAALAERTSFDQAQLQKAQVLAKVYSDSQEILTPILVESQLRGYAGGVASLQRDLRRMSQQREYADSAGASWARFLQSDQTIAVASMRDRTRGRESRRTVLAGLASALSILVTATTWRWFSLRARGLMPARLP